MLFSCGGIDGLPLPAFLLFTFLRESSGSRAKGGFTALIEVSHLSKDYGNFSAVRDVSFGLVPGEILGFLGPNGAGKSTSMKMLTGFLRPSSGNVSIWGCDVWSDPIAAQQHLGYLPEGAPAYEEMRVHGFLKFIGEARGLSGQSLTQAIDQVAVTMSLQDVLAQKIETLSKGFKRRVGLAQAIIHDPDVLILDEPTDGLDPNQKHQVREMIKGLSREKIVIVSTHILEEVTAVCNRAVVLSAGQIVADTSPEELLTRSRHHGAVSLTVNATDLEALVSSMSALAGVGGVERSGNRLTVFPEADGIKLDLLLDACREQGCEIADLIVEQGRLDEVFRSLTEGSAQ